MFLIKSFSVVLDNCIKIKDFSEGLKLCELAPSFQASSETQLRVIDAKDFFKRLGEAEDKRSRNNRIMVTLPCSLLLLVSI